MAPDQAIEIIGPSLTARHAEGRPLARIATVFPAARAIVTLAGIHASHRCALVDKLNAAHLAAGRPLLTAQEERAVFSDAVDLILEDHDVLIRPDPGAMALAFAADELLQQLVSKRHIKFLDTTEPRVRQAIKQRGECWRIVPRPASPAELRDLLERARIGIRGRPIYYYNNTTGTRFLTCAAFAGLAALDDAELRGHLQEVREFTGRYNSRGFREVAFHMADASFNPAALAPLDFEAMDATRLHAVHAELAARFEQAVRPELRRDGYDNALWRNAMVCALLGKPGEAVPEESLLGLSPEFFMQVQWLPGARIEGGELLFDSVFAEPVADPRQQRRLEADEEQTRGFLFNLVRAYPDLCYANLGRVVNSLADRPAMGGRREVFLAQVKPCAAEAEVMHVIRMQKWGVSEHLDENMNLLDAMLRSEEYTDYVLDRRLGCRQLGMRMAARIVRQQITETYGGKQRAFQGRQVWSTYFERDYIPGIATPKIPPGRFRNPEFAQRFARLLGEAAAVNLVVGRVNLSGAVIFDDGDELLTEDERGVPVEIIVSDPTGAFGDFQHPLEELAPGYAAPISRRLSQVPDPTAFIAAYLTGLDDRLTVAQGRYQRHRQAFDTLFRHRQRDPGGNFVYRWEQVLKRLDKARPESVLKAVRSRLTP